jgi:hypothetical protein
MDLGELNSFNLHSELVAPSRLRFYAGTNADRRRDAGATKPVPRNV